MSNIQKTNIGKLDLGMISALEVLLRERSVNRAALHAGLSQPAMSNALARMRIAFDDPLVVRGRKGLMLTEQGQILLDQLAALSPQLARLGHITAFDPQRTDIAFHVAATDHVCLVFMPEIMRLFSTEAPAGVLKVATVLSRETDLDRLEAGGFDVRVGWFAELPAHWHVRKLFQEELVLIARSDHPALLGDIDLETFLTLKHIVLAPDRRSTRNLADDALAAKKVKRTVGAFVSSFAAMPFMVEKSDMVAVLPGRVARQYAFLPNLTILPSPFPFRDFDVHLAWHPRAHHDTASMWLRDLIVRAAARVDAA